MVQGGSRWPGEQILAPVPWQHTMTPLHTSGGGMCSQDKLLCLPGVPG